MRTLFNVSASLVRSISEKAELMGAKIVICWLADKVVVVPGGNWSEYSISGAALLTCPKKLLQCQAEGNRKNVKIALIYHGIIDYFYTR